MAGKHLVWSTVICLIIFNAIQVQCDREHLFQVPAHKDRFEILERTNFKSSEESGSSASESIEEPSSAFANAQISLRFGGDPNPCLPVPPVPLPTPIPPQSPCQCKPVCHCGKSQPINLFYYAPAQSVQPVTPIVPPMGSQITINNPPVAVAPPNSRTILTCVGCGSPLPCGCGAHNTMGHILPGVVQPSVQGSQVWQPQSGLYVISGSPALGHNYRQAGPGNVWWSVGTPSSSYPTVGAPPAQTLPIVPPTGYNKLSWTMANIPPQNLITPVNTNHPSGLYYYLPSNNAALNQPALLTPIAQPAPYTPMPQPRPVPLPMPQQVSFTPIYRPSAPSTSVVQPPYLPPVIQTPCPTPATPIYTPNFPAILPSKQILKPVTNNHPEILRPVILPNPVSCREDEIINDKIEKKLAELERSKTELLRKLEIIESDVKKQELRPTVVIKPKPTPCLKATKPEELRIDIVDKLEGSSPQYSKIEFVPWQLTPQYSTGPKVDTISHELLKAALLPYAASASGTTWRSPSAPNQEIFVTRPIVTKPIVRPSPSQFETILNKPWMKPSTTLLESMLAKPSGQPSGNFEFSSYGVSSGAQVYSDPSKTVIRKEPTVISMVGPIRGTVSGGSSYTHKPAVVVEEPSWEVSPVGGTWTGPAGLRPGCAEESDVLVEEPSWRWEPIVRSTSSLSRPSVLEYATADEDFLTRPKIDSVSWNSKPLCSKNKFLLP